MDTTQKKLILIRYNKIMDNTLLSKTTELTESVIELKESTEEATQCQDRVAKFMELIKGGKLITQRHIRSVDKDLEIPKGNYVDDKYNKLK